MRDLTLYLNHNNETGTFWPSSNAEVREVVRIQMAYNAAVNVQGDQPKQSFGFSADAVRAMTPSEEADHSEPALELVNV